MATASRPEQWNGVPRVTKLRPDPADGLPELEAFSCNVSGWRIQARRAPGPDDGTPVLLIHGQGVSSRFEAPAGRAFAADFPVLVPDQPGFGGSEGPPRALDVDHLADFVAAFLRACGVGRAHLVGTSFGCQVAVACAIRHPASVARVVLQGPSSAPENRGALRLVSRWWQNGRQEPPETRLLLSQYRAAGFRRVFATFNHYRHYPLEEMLPRVAAPTLVVRGEHDRLVSQPWAERVADLLPDGALAVAPGAAHTMAEEARRRGTAVPPRPRVTAPDRQYRTEVEDQIDCRSGLRHSAVGITTSPSPGRGCITAPVCIGNRSGGRCCSR